MISMIFDRDVKELFKITGLVAAGIILLVFSLHPAKYWLPFASEFPPWLTEVPLMQTIMQSAPLLFASFFIACMIWMVKKFV